jgi:hypothetical protein
MYLKKQEQNEMNNSSPGLKILPYCPLFGKENEVTKPKESKESKEKRKNSKECKG